MWQPHGERAPVPDCAGRTDLLSSGCWLGEELSLGENKKLDFTLQLAAITETVDVVGAPAPMDTSRAGATANVSEDVSICLHREEGVPATLGKPKAASPSIPTDADIETEAKLKAGLPTRRSPVWYQFTLRDLGALV
jgi:hypothetical protein